jgi:transcriptional regulator with XRE-family HTH domain
MAKANKILNAREIFARNVRRVRRWKEISQESLALEAGLSRPYVGQIERAERAVSIDIMGQIANALGVPLRSLVDPEVRMEDL